MLLMSKASLCIRSRIIWKQREGTKYLGNQLLGLQGDKNCSRECIAADTFISHCWDWKESPQWTNVKNGQKWSLKGFVVMCRPSSPGIYLIQLLFPLSSWSFVKFWLWVWFLCWGEEGWVSDLWHLTECFKMYLKWSEGSTDPCTSS